MANWNKIGSRGNVDDRRSIGPVAIGGVTLAGVAIVFAMNLLNGGDFGNALLNTLETVLQQGQNTQNAGEFAGEDPYEVFSSTVLGSTNDTWNEIFLNANSKYIEPKLVLFRQATESACGVATSQVGPHYCSLDQTIYLDETFFDEMINRFGAKGGDVAQAYVIAHEVGHHVQNLTGILNNLSNGDNETSIKAELQADCYAGIWAYSIKDQNVFESGEIMEAMDAAASVGDDRIQEKTQGYINPETFTHGTSKQRQEWFMIGYNQGEISSCNTFK